MQALRVFVEVIMISVPIVLMIAAAWATYTRKDG